MLNALQMSCDKWPDQAYNNIFSVPYSSNFPTSLPHTQVHYIIFKFLGFCSHSTLSFFDFWLKAVSKAGQAQGRVN